MRKILLSLILALMSVTVFADYTRDVAVNGVTYRLDDDALTARVQQAATTLTGNIVIPASITDGGNTYNVVELYHSVFMNCTGITSVVLPNTITALPLNTFNNCTSLTSVTLPEGLLTINQGAFSDCSSLPAITIPSTVTTISVGVFNGCTNLTTITILSDTFVGSCGSTYNLTYYFGDQVTSYIFGDAVTVIPSEVLKDKTNLTSVTFGTGLQTIGSYAFQGCTGLTSVTIPNAVTSIGGSAFRGTGLTSVTLGDGLTSIGGYAFYNCASLASVTFGSGLTTIGYAAFSGCSSLTEISLPESLTEIENEAFYHCGLTSLVLPKNLQSIGAYAFSGCAALKTVTVLASLTSIGSDVFYECSAVDAITLHSDSFLQKICQSILSAGSKPSTLVFGDEVTRIPDYLFNNQTNLTSLSFGSGLDRIGNYAFSGCSNLTSVTLGSNLTVIASSAFENCTGLTSIELPNSLALIASGAFSGCTGLTEIAIPASVTEIYGGFSGCTNLTKVTINSPAVMNDSEYKPEDFFGEQVTTYILGDEITAIGNNAFANLSNLTSVTVSNNLASIGDYAFRYCSNLASFTGGDNVNTIGQSAFQNCSSLTSLLFLRATSIGSGAFQNCTSLQSCNIPVGLEQISVGTFYNCSSLQSVTIPSSVTSIGEVAFLGCTGLTEITIPSSVTSIGAYAFENCTGLTEITIPASVTELGREAFSECENLLTVTIHSDAFLSQDFVDNYSNCDEYFGEQVTSYIIGDEVTGVGSRAFFGCGNLTSITLGSGVQSIGDDAFYYCENLNSVSLPEGLQTIGQGAFSGTNIHSITIPSSVTAIGSNAFYVDTVTIHSNAVMSREFDDSNNFKNLFGSGVKACILGDEIEAIGNYAFYENENLSSVTLGNGVQSIGENAFRRCTSLISVDLPSSLQTIKYNAFAYCRNLSSITIPASVTTIAESAFEDCENLKTVTINSDAFLRQNFAYPVDSRFGEQVTTYIIGDEVTAIGNKAFYTCANISSVTLGSGLKTIGNNAFYYCGGLSSIVIPDSVTTIGENAFGGCSGLSSVTLGSGVQSIGVSAFSGCPFSTLTIPAGVTSIGNKAFFNCGSLATVYNYAETPQIVGNIGSFSNWDLYVPCGTQSLYEAAAGWQNCKSINQFNCASFTITWLNEDGSLIEETTWGQGELPTHEPPTKEGNAEFSYVFNGWSPEIVPVEGDATYQATFRQERNIYTITWRMDEGSLIDQTHVPYGEMPTHEEPGKPNYHPNEYSFRFAGWTPEIVPVVGDAEYTAVFDTIWEKFTAAFVDYQGDTLQVDTVFYGRYVEYRGETPTRPSDETDCAYEFVGWDPDPEHSIIWRDTVFTPVFKKILTGMGVSYSTLPAVGDSVTTQKWYNAADKLGALSSRNSNAYYIDQVAFLNADGSTFSEETFLQDKEYQAVIIFNVIQGGYNLPETIGADFVVINGTAAPNAYYDDGFSRIYAPVIFTPGVPVIREVNLTVETPKAGDAVRACYNYNPATSDVATVNCPPGAPYTCTKYVFYKEGECFDEAQLLGETTYMMGMELTAAEGYTFPSEMDDDGYERVRNEQIRFIINGVEVHCAEHTVGAANCYLEFTTGKTEGLNNIEAESSATKVIRDGVLYIIRDGRTYNAQGVKVE